ncbi:MAG: helix-turn-helix domain-containing protein [Clostridia bacterium]|nr:helix-turn-helix domain-containing protein [Clostridia bacterium]
MAASKLGTLIKKARTAAGLSQDSLARKVTGFSAGDLAKTESGEMIPTQDVLKRLAKPLGLTQKEVLDAAKADRAAASKTTAAKKTAAKTTSAKTTSAKTSSAKTTSAKTSSAKTSSSKTSSAKTTAAKPKTPANANSTMKVTDTERKLVDAYRAASAAQKKAALKLLKGEADAQLDAINGTNSAADAAGDFIQNALSGLVENLMGK